MVKNKVCEKVALDFVLGVRRLITDRLIALDLPVEEVQARQLLMPGKLLRTRLAARLAGGGFFPVVPTPERLCAATELAHTASLCHDDVIDGAFLRRSCPALWQVEGPTAAVLIGDLLLCEALDLLLYIEEGRFLPLFVSKIREVCRAEAEQELRMRGKPMEEDACLRLARSKTGPLFAFIARVCAGGQPDLASALEEAGYRIGTAYQLADDLLDFVGSDDLAGKTLGTDLQRQHWTLPRVAGAGRAAVQTHIQRLCRSALDCVGAWPHVVMALEEFISLDVKPVFDRHGGELYDLVRIS